MVTIAQFSDTHFAEPGHRSHSGFGYDTDLAWERVFAQGFSGAHAIDSVVVTGDLADHGEPHEYVRAFEALGEIPVPTNVLAGNHDFDQPLRDAAATTNIGTERELIVGPWQYLFVDSNGDVGDTTGRIESDPHLGAWEIVWLDEAIAATNADHVWLWMHHPPAAHDTWAHSPKLDTQVTELIGRHPTIRGIGAGHVHTDLERSIADRPVIMCPALTICIDFVNFTTRAPGWRLWTFNDDGTFTSECHRADADDQAWPEFDLPQPIIDQQLGKITWDEAADYMAQLAAFV